MSYDPLDGSRLRAGRDALAEVLEETFGSFEDHGVYNVVDEVLGKLYRHGWEVSQRAAGTHGGPYPFVLVRDEDPTGVSGTGVVAEGVEFTTREESDDAQGVVALRWLSEWPTSVVFHDRGIDSVVAVHGHDGKTRVVWK